MRGRSRSIFAPKFKEFMEGFRLAAGGIKDSGLPSSTIDDSKSLVQPIAHERPVAGLVGKAHGVTVKVEPIDEEFQFPEGGLAQEGLWSPLDHPE